jgi:hypothetical protein
MRTEAEFIDSLRFEWDVSQNLEAPVASGYPADEIEPSGLC